MKRSVFPLLVLLCAAAAAQTDGQHELKVGDPVIQSAKLKPYRNSWRLTLSSADGKALGETAIWTDQLIAIRKHGQRCFERVQKATFSKDGKVVGTTETVNIFTRDTMTPVWRRFSTHTGSVDQQQETLVEFDGGKTVHVSQKKGSSASNQSFVLEKPAFDFNGGLYGLVFAAMDLKEGMSGSIPSISESDFTSPTETIRFTVGKAEKVSAGSSTIEAFPVNVESKAGQMKFWVSKQKPYIIQLDFHDAQHGNLLWSYRMIGNHKAQLGA